MIILNLREFPPEDILEEILDEEVFTLKEYFLRQPVISVLYHSRIRKLGQLNEISQSFLRSNGKQLTPPKPSPLTSTTFLTLLQSYEDAMAQLRLEISKSPHPMAIATLAEHMIEVQRHYEHNFMELFTNEFSDVSLRKEEEVKAADQIDSGSVIQLLKSEENAYTQLEKEYVRIKSLISK